jgi:hypothetical protein
MRLPPSPGQDREGVGQETCLDLQALFFLRFFWGLTCVTQDRTSLLVAIFFDDFFILLPFRPLPYDVSTAVYFLYCDYDLKLFDCFPTLQTNTTPCV